MENQYPALKKVPRPLERGVGVIEALVVVSIATVAFVAILSAAVFFLRGGLYAADKVQALYLLEEGVEAMRFLRDESYTTNITPYIEAGVRYLDPAAGSWSVESTSTPIFGEFTRTILLEEVYRRNTDDDIVPSTSGDPKTLDAGTARLTTTVSWGAGSVSSITYVADLYDN